MILPSIVVISLMLLSGSQIGVIAQGPPVDVSSDNFTVDTGQITIKVTGGGNVPIYTFWETVNDDTEYRVQFTKIFEVFDDNSDGVYDQDTDRIVPGPPYALAALSWDFSEVTSDEDGSHFNISSSDGLFTFANHVGNDATSLKFDVIISEDFTFQSTESLLVLGFSLKNIENAGDETIEQVESSVAFDDAFFNIEETAQDENGDINVGLSTGSEEGGSLAYIAYEQFTGQMVHDPTVGIDEDGIQVDDTDQITVGLWAPGISKGLAALSALFATTITILIPMAYYKRKK